MAENVQQTETATLMHLYTIVKYVFYDIFEYQRIQ